MASNGLYTEFFGFSERPFTLLPDPDHIYWSPLHRKAIAVLEYGLVSRAPITLVTGEIGAGKTTLVQALLKRAENDVTIGLISNAQGGRGELLRWIANAFDIDTSETRDDYVGLFQKFQDFLLEEYAAGRRAVLIVDEAQNLSAEGLEEVRMLTNMNSGKDELIQLILVGQPELRDMVRQPNMRQLAQRISANIHLKALDRQTVPAYITHRLISSGGTGTEISTDAIDLIFEQSHGTPRVINQLCDLSLLYAWGEDQKEVDGQTVRAVLDDGLFFADAHTGTEV